MSKEVKKAIRAALKNPQLVKRAAKDAAESYVRGRAYREIDKMREADEAEEAEESPEVEKAEKAVAAPSRGVSISPASGGSALPMSPADFANRLRSR